MFFKGQKAKGYDLGGNLIVPTRTATIAKS